MASDRAFILHMCIPCLRPFCCTKAKAICQGQISVSTFFSQKALTMAITLEWYFQTFLWYQGQSHLSISKSNIKVAFFKKWPSQGHWCLGNASCSV